MKADVFVFKDPYAFIVPQPGSLRPVGIVSARQDVYSKPTLRVYHFGFQAINYLPFL